MTAPNSDDGSHSSYTILWVGAGANIGDDNRHAQRELRSIINRLKTFEGGHQFQ
jgi:hypothetical protein